MLCTLWLVNTLLVKQQHFRPKYRPHRFFFPVLVILRHILRQVRTFVQRNEFVCILAGEPFQLLPWLTPPPPKENSKSICFRFVLMEWKSTAGNYEVCFKVARFVARVLLPSEMCWQPPQIYPGAESMEPGQPCIKWKPESCDFGTLRLCVLTHPIIV